MENEDLLQFPEKGQKWY